VYLEVVVHGLEVLGQGQGSGEGVAEIFDPLLGEVMLKPLDQLLDHQPHVLKALALHTVAL
jgi:hypothetical protein